MEETQELIERFEDETGLNFDPNGPELKECECGKLIQFIIDHDCYITQGENHDARRLDDCGWE